jgi:dUTP pyrophosphatase
MKGEENTMWTSVKLVAVSGSNPTIPEYQTKNSACADIPAHFHSGEVTYFDPNVNKKYIKIPQERGGVKRITIHPQERVMIPTGWRMLIPFGYHIAVNPRSGLSLKSGLCILNAPGTIDADYTDEVFVLLTNISNTSVEVSEGDRVAQLEIIEDVSKSTYFTNGTEEELLAHKAESDRIGGFGSTGIGTNK